MNYRHLVAALLASGWLSACAPMTHDDQAVATGAVAGAIFGGVAAQIVGAGSGATAAAAGVGAMAGSMVVRNSERPPH